MARVPGPQLCPLMPKAESSSWDQTLWPQAHSATSSWRDGRQVTSPQPQFSHLTGSRREVSKAYLGSSTSGDGAPLPAVTTTIELGFPLLQPRATRCLPLGPLGSE